MLETLKRELILRGYSSQTIKKYVWFNEDFIRFAKKEPKEVSGDDIKDYFILLRVKRRYENASVRLAWNALRFYYHVIWKRPFFKNIPLPKRSQKMPVVLTKEELRLMIDNTINDKHKTILILLYGSGLRLSEVVKLKYEHLMLEQGLGIVKYGKGNKDRYFIIPKTAVNFLRKDKEGIIFNVTKRTVQLVVKDAAKKAGISQKVSPHTLRHSFATHLLENNVDIRKIQKLLGHKKLETTQIYTHLSTKQLKEIPSPADSITL